ncbi:unnamed protein product [Scytosiphon promiscuus]
MAEKGREASDGVEEMAVIDEATPTVAKLSLKVHEIAKDAQNHNGLRHGDYHQYRQYCTRRLKRVRSARQVRFMFGKGKSFVPKELTPEDVTTASHLEIPLMTAERAWAYAMQRKQETAGAPYRVRRHVVTRLAKAAKWAGDLEALCLKTADERTCLEATAYCAWMSGNLLLEKEAWRDALDRYSTAHRICQELGKVGRIEDQDLFSRRVEEIEPILRYCRYNLDTGSSGDGGGGGEMAAAAEKHLLEMGQDEDSSAGGDLLAAKLESVVAEARKKQASALDSVEWRGKRVAVRSETLRVALVKADELALRLRRASDGPTAAERAAAGGSGKGGGDPKPGQYLKVFGAYDEALATVSEELSRLQGKGGGTKMEAHRAELEALRAYAQHHKLRLMLQRNERLVQELQEKRKSAGGGGGGERDPLGEVADIVHVYDALLQSVRSMVTNLGGGDDANDDIAEEEDELVESVRADEARFRAFRCFFVIEAFLAQQKWAEASALFGHTRTLCREATDMLDDDDDPRAESLARLDEMVEGAWHRTAAHALLLKAKQDSALSALVDGIAISGGGGGAGAGRAGLPLRERLKVFDAAAGGGGGGVEGGSKKRKYRIADFPPSLQLVPCKPRLLDLAFDELEFPDLDERAGIEKEAEAEEKTKSSAGGAGGRGWFGWALGR